MANFPLTVVKKGLKTMKPINSEYSDEYTEQRCTLYLSDELHRNSENDIVTYYRLRAKEHHTIEDALAYDILCPKCNWAKMKQVGRMLNSRELGLYVYPMCNQNKEY